MRHIELIDMTDKEVDSLYDEMRELAAELHVPLPHERLIVETISASSGERTKHIDRYSKSFTRNVYNIWLMNLAPFLQGTTYADGSKASKVRASTIKNYVNTSLCTQEAELNPGIGYYVTGTLTVYGVVVGTGNTPESFDDYTVETLIPHGTGGGQLSYAGMTQNSSGWDVGGGYWHNKYTRPFTNGSGGTVTVYEFIQYWGAWVPSFMTFLFSRDVEAGGIAVPNGDVLEVSYEHRVTFP